MATLLDASTGTERFRFPGTVSPCGHASFSASGKLLATLSGRVAVLCQPYTSVTVSVAEYEPLVAKDFVSVLPVPLVPSLNVQL